MAQPADPKVSVVRRVRDQIETSTEARTDQMLELMLFACYPTKEAQNS